MTGFPVGLAFIAYRCTQGTEPSELTGVWQKRHSERRQAVDMAPDLAGVSPGRCAISGEVKPRVAQSLHEFLILNLHSYPAPG